MRHSVFILSILLMILILTVSSCDLSKPLSSFSLTPSPQPSPIEIYASLGGEVKLFDKTIVRVPPGALQSDTQVSISKKSVSDLPIAPDEISIVGSVYDINLGTTSLNKPITLEIPFDPKLLPSGTDSSQVFLSYYDNATNKWVYAGGVVDTNRNVVVIQTSHASLWMPTTWNWGAWIAVLDKMFQGSVVDWIEAVQLLTTDCPQTGNYVQLDSSQSRSVVQGCIDVDDSNQPELRIVNPKSFFFEIKPVSGGNGYPSSTLLAPGDDVKFKASTSDPSPLIIQAEMTQKASWYLVVHMIISMLPGANEFGIQSQQVACITERLSDISDLASAAESLVNNDGAAAADSISKFMGKEDTVRRFITAADDCHFGPAPTWSPEGIKQIGASISTIMSATDYIANYFAGNSTAQISFIWNSTVSAPENGTKLIGNWQGNIKIQGEGTPITYQFANFQFSAACQQSDLCLTITNENGAHFIQSPPSVEIPFSNSDHELGDYCFILSDNGLPLYTECFTPQQDGTLLYKAGGALTYFEGILYKIEK